MNNEEQWIFFLQLERNLPKEFFDLDSQFKMNGKSLVPIGMKTLSSVVASSQENIHVFIMIKSVRDYFFFEKRIKKMMKYIVRSGRVNIYVASSFNKMIDSDIMKKDHYNFLKLPVSMNYLCGSISRTIDLKNSRTTQKWPGGVKSKIELAP